MASKQELVEFLDRRVFDPILHTSEDKYSGKQRERLNDVKRRTEAEKTRFHNYESAQKVVEMYKDDLSSEKAKPVNAHLEELGLPRLVDVKNEFYELAGETGKS